MTAEGCRASDAQKVGPRGEEDKARWEVDQSPSAVLPQNTSQMLERQKNFALQALRCINRNKQHIREDESCPG